MAVLNDAKLLRDFHSLLLAEIHFHNPQLSLQCSYIVAHCQGLNLTLTCSYILATLWAMAKAKHRPSNKPWVKSRKDDVVRMRVSTEQKLALMDAAEREGLELSAWLRQLALRAAGVLPEAK